MLIKADFPPITQDHYDQLQECYNELNPSDQQLLKLLSVLFVGTSYERLVIILNHLEWFTVEGKPYHETNLRVQLKRLFKAKLIKTDGTRFRDSAQVDYRLTHFYCRNAEAEDSLEDLEKALAFDQILDQKFRRHSVPFYLRKTTNHERLARWATYNQDPVSLIEAFDYFNDINDNQPHQIARCLLDNPMEPDWIASRHPAIRAALIWPLLEVDGYECLPNSKWMPLFEELASEPEVELCPFYNEVLCEQLVLRGRTEEAMGLKLRADGSSAIFLSAWLALITGEEGAISLYKKGLKVLRKELGTNRVALPASHRAYYIFALVATKDATRMKEALRIARSESSYHVVVLVNALEAFVQTMIDPTYHEGGRLKVHNKSSNVLHAYLEALCRYWLNAEALEDELDTLDQLRQVAADGGYLWLEAELCDLLARMDHREQETGPRAAHLHKQMGTKPLATLIEVTPPWQRTLDALVKITGSPAKAETSVGGLRLIWQLRPDDFDCDIRAVQQKYGHKGWTKGKTVSLQGLAESPAQFDFLTSQDLEVIGCLKNIDTSLYRSTPTIGFDTQAALRALTGHPQLFLWDNPNERIILEQGQPEIRIERNGDRMEVSFHPKLTFSHNYLIREESPSRYKLYELKPEHERIHDILDGGLSVPARGEKKLIEAVTALSGSLMVNSELPRGKARNTIPGDTKLHVQLLPHGDGLKLMPVVRPFGEGPYFKPGEGGHTVFALIGQERKAASRDLTAEERALEQFMEACPTLASGEETIGEWHFEEPEACLSLLVELQNLGEEVIPVWPEGESMQVRQVSQQGLSLSVRSGIDWFELDGKLTVSEGEVMAMRTLLKLVAKHPGRFVPIGDGRFMALTRGFRQRLDEVNSLTETQNTRRLSPLGALSLQELIREAGRVDLDQAWHDQLNRMNSSLELNPEVPNTLQAELRPYQEQGFKWLARLAQWGVGACLADDMGLGKTIQTLALLLRLAPDGPALVVAPTSVCSNWLDEAARFAPTLNASRFGAGDRQEHIEALGPFDVVICSYGLLQHETELLTMPKWRSVVLDEAQAIKNYHTRRAKAAALLKSDFRLITTGTPIENHLLELWSLFKFLNPGMLGTRESFVRRFVTPIDKFKEGGARNALKKLVRPFILRRVKSQVLTELPPRTEIVLHVELSDQEQASYEALRQTTLEQLEKPDRNQPGQGHIKILAAIMKMRRACCNPKLIDPNTNLSSSKLELFSEVVEELLENQHKALVFSQFVDHLAIIRAYLDEQEIPYQYLDGSTPTGQRAKRVAAFQAGEGDIFLISLKAGGVGLNLTAADFVIHMDPWWNPAVEDQASDRAHRIGQDRPVTVYRLVTKGTIEEKIVKLHTRKRDLTRNLLEGSDLAGKMDAAELLNLIRQNG